MKKRSSILLIPIFTMMLIACSQPVPNITGYLIDKSNNIVVIYDNENQEIIGNLSDETISDLITSITISKDGYFVINSFKTEKMATFSSVTISNNGFYIIDGILTTIQVNYNSIIISSDGYYVVDGIKTDIEVKYETIAISSTGYYIIDGIETNIKVDFENIEMSTDGYYIINGIKTNIKVEFETVEISSDGYYIINGIQTNIKATNVYTVKFVTGYSASLADQKIFEGYKIEKPQLSRTGYKLKGWFCNGEEWRFNSDVVLNDMTLVAKWIAKQYTISFINEKGSNPDDIIVTYDAKYTLPVVENVSGYTFDGWYDGATKYSDGTWKTDSNVTLTAKWTANSYKVTLNPGPGSVSSKTKTVTYGKNYSLPVPTYEYGVFEGWLLDGVLVTDDKGKSLAPWTFTENKTFTVDWAIKLYSEEDLQKIKKYPYADFQLMNDIYITSTNWNPIGNYTIPFSGHFNGNNHTIFNLSIDTLQISSNTEFGFFGVISGATIENFGISNYSFKSDNISHSYSVGALFGESSEINGTSIIINCFVEGEMNITSQSSSHIINAGGLAGCANGVLFNKCINNIAISNAHYAGGIVGVVDNANVFDSLNQNSVSASLIAGGLVGVTNSTATISGCKNSSSIHGGDNAGGIIGSGGYQTEIDQCINEGNISSTTQGTFFGAGGLVGITYSTNGNGLPYTKITNSYNSGDISSYMAGGLIGITYSSFLKDNYNSGSINGLGFSAGLCGFSADTTICQCLATGSISGEIKFTLVGQSLGFSAPDCYHTYNTNSYWHGVEGTRYTGVLYSDEFYKNYMYWTDDYWDYHESVFPTLKIETTLEESSNKWK